MALQTQTLTAVQDTTTNARALKAVKKVVVIQKSVPQYRVDFFNKLRAEMESRNIELDLVYGDTSVDSRKDNAKCPWATFVANKNIRLGRFTLVWQPVLQYLRDADLVIAEQAHKLLLNRILRLRQSFMGKRYAYYGHGRNLQLPEGSLLNRVKMRSLKAPFWWFAYTEGRKQFLVRNGVDPKRITAVQNAIDTRTMNRQYNAISAAEIATLRSQLGIRDTDRVLIFCGALSAEKNFELLVAAADRLQERVPQIKLLIVGSGPYQQFLEQAANTRPWLLVLGARFGKEKTALFRLAELFLMTGANNLSVLDAFAYETPVVTVDIPNHGPEYEYLVEGANAITCAPDPVRIAAAAAGLLMEPGKINAMQRSCRDMIEQYNLENMVRNFADGIENALKTMEGPNR